MVVLDYKSLNMKYIYLNRNEDRVVAISKNPLESHSYLECYAVQDDFDLSKTIIAEGGKSVSIPNSISATEFLTRYSADYVQKRVNEYPSIEDQLDKIFHEGIESWKNSIQEIKDKYPKPNQGN